ncbi:MAG TPA: serine hydrolase domain-containing protein [SAR202 cluster bacterium]|nr:serine hydrolase domain-containing protein [SAR202 cluster bacterium]|tara:strand:+ start:36860 stop:38065 length:1206 start_codon:yes stop_codon:yes gene_type:complete
MGTFGFSTEKLGNIESYLQEKYIDTNRYVGTLTGIYRNGQLGFISTLGLMDRESRKPIERDTIFRIYSMTKPITSVALMSLYEKGLFQLDDPVSEYIPAFKDLNVYAEGIFGNYKTTYPDREMTIRDLLSHQSGLTYGFMERSNVDAAYRELGIEKESQQNLQEFVNVLSTIPLEFSPGTAWNYSVSTDVCGYLIEVISGKTLDMFLEEEIFQPLGMADTGFYVPSSKTWRLSSNYEYREGQEPILVDDANTGSYINPPTLFSGGGGLVSTLDDYMAFCKMVLGRGSLEGHRILSRKTLDLMSSNHLTNGKDLRSCAYGRWSETSYTGVGFGLGFSVLLNPAASQVSGSKGELAWGGAASTAFWIDPLEDMAVVFLTQLLPSSTYNVRRELRSLVYSALSD